MKDAAAMPTIATQHEFVEAGCERVRDFNRRAALYVDEIMRGAKPADLPIQQPTRFFVTINRPPTLSGLTIPLELLVLSDEIIE
jgi:putative ABC transport system substrate-binding protein